MFLSMSAKIKAEMEEAKKENDLDFSDEKLITWKARTAGLTRSPEYVTITRQFSVVK